jgi:hypothetical protein
MYVVFNSIRIALRFRVLYAIFSIALIALEMEVTRARLECFLENYLEKFKMI